METDLNVMNTLTVPTNAENGLEPSTSLIAVTTVNAKTQTLLAGQDQCTEHAKMQVVTKKITPAQLTTVATGVGRQAHPQKRQTARTNTTTTVMEIQTVMTRTANHQNGRTKDKTHQAS